VLEFIEFAAFTSRLAALARDNAEDVLLGIQNDLLQNPLRGSIVQGTAGVRKARASDPSRGKGKRGGLRYLYYYIERDREIYLLMIFNKSEQDELTGDQKKILASVVRELGTAK
jgi:hypothetical protein